MLCASEWVAVAWSKVSFAFCVFVILWEGRSIQVGWSPISCVLYVDPAECHCVGGATHQPASRDSYPQSHACGGQEIKSSYKSVI